MEYALRRGVGVGVANWWALTVVGVIVMLIGLACFIWPIGAVESIIYIFGFFALAAGLFNLVGMFRAGPHGWVFLLKAIISFLAGALALWNPAGFFLAGYALIAVWAVVSGVFEIIGALANSRQLGGGATFLEAIGGVISIAFGVLLWTNILVGSLAIIFLLGIYGVVYGIFLVAFSIQVRTTVKVAVSA
jgi:uncharacterized membrane protein HdeD (DUF308 family)